MSVKAYFHQTKELGSFFLWQCPLHFNQILTSQQKQPLVVHLVQFTWSTLCPGIPVCTLHGTKYRRNPNIVLLAQALLRHVIQATLSLVKRLLSRPSFQLHLHVLHISHRR